MLHPNIIGNYECNKSVMLAQDGVQLTANLESDIATNFGRQAITSVNGSTFLANNKLHQEVF